MALQQQMEKTRVQWNNRFETSLTLVFDKIQKSLIGETYAYFYYPINCYIIVIDCL